MKKKKKSKCFTSGEITSYKFPVIKGPEGEAFYQWLNSYEKYGYRSVNNLFTEALKLKFMMDHLKINDGIALNKSYPTDVVKKQDDILVFDVEDIDLVESNGFTAIEKTFGSIKR